MENKNQINELCLPKTIKTIDANNVKNEFGPYEIKDKIYKIYKHELNKVESFRKSCVIFNKFNKILQIKYKNQENTFTTEEMDEILPIRAMYYCTHDWNQGAISEFIDFRKNWKFPILYSQVRGDYIPTWDQWECFGMIKSEITISEFIKNFNSIFNNTFFYNYIDNNDKLWLSIDIISDYHFYPYALTPQNDDTDEEYECGNINSEKKIANKIEIIEQRKKTTRQRKKTTR